MPADAFHPDQFSEKDTSTESLAPEIVEGQLGPAAVQAALQGEAADDVAVEELVAEEPETADPEALTLSPPEIATQPLVFEVTIERDISAAVRVPVLNLHEPTVMTDDNPIEGGASPDTRVVELHREHVSWMNVIEETLGSEDYQHYYVRDEETGEEVDVLDDGQESCAYYLSNVLKEMELLPCAHATVPSTLKCMEENGWEPDDQERIGGVVVWTNADESTAHIGVVVGPGRYVSHSSIKRRPVVHTWWTKAPARYFSHPTATTNEAYENVHFISVWDLAGL